MASGPSWAFMNWVQLHDLNPEQIVTGNIDATVNDDIIIDFGATYGLWAFMNNVKLGSAPRPQSGADNNG